MRYARHMLLHGFDEIHQQKLAKSSVAVAGAGGLGSGVLIYLAAAGVGHIGVIDFDVVSESNLNRQVLYNPGVIGKLKSQEAARRLKEINPDCKLTVFNQKISADNAIDIFSGFDVVVDATDNFATRYVVDDACKALNTPFVYGSAEQWGGQISVFHYQGAGSYRDLYPNSPPVSSTPPGVMGPVPGVVGTRQAIEVIKIITGQGAILAGKLMVLDMLNNRDTVFELAK